jgi:hypothetical protein
MQVAAFSTPTDPDWRWRIVNYAGEVVEESRGTFPSISAALTTGTKRMVELNVVDRSSAPPRNWRSTSHLRTR